MSTEKLPVGWDEDQIQGVIAHYEGQTEAEQFAEIEAAHQDSTVPRRLRLDLQGRLIVPTDAEHEARSAAVKRMIEDIREIPNGPDEDDRDFFRAIDEERPERPLFKGRY